MSTVSDLVLPRAEQEKARRELVERLDVSGEGADALIFDASASNRCWMPGCSGVFGHVECPSCYKAHCPGDCDPGFFSLA